jgi:hypothetical protein
MFAFPMIYKIAEGPTTYSAYIAAAALIAGLTKCLRKAMSWNVVTMRWHMVEAGMHVAT